MESNTPDIITTRPYTCVTYPQSLAYTLCEGGHDFHKFLDRLHTCGLRVDRSVKDMFNYTYRVTDINKYRLAKLRHGI